MKFRSLILIVGVLNVIVASATESFACETNAIEALGTLNSQNAQISPNDIPPISASIEANSLDPQGVQELTINDSTGRAHNLVLAYFQVETGQWEVRILALASELSNTSGDLVVVGAGSLSFNSSGDRIDAPFAEDMRLNLRWNTGGFNRDVRVKFMLVTKPQQSFLSAKHNGTPGGCSRGANLDFDGDGYDDLAVWRPEFGMWAVLKSSTEGTDLIFKQWGLPGDYPMPGDYTGDGKADLVVWRNADGSWYICRSEVDFDCSLPTITQFGLPGDLPIKGDYDGDGILDLAVYRLSNGTFYYQSSRDSTIVARQWGLPGDLPVLSGINSILPSHNR